MPECKVAASIFPGMEMLLKIHTKHYRQYRRAFDTIAAQDLYPFAKWAAAKMPALMTAHIAYPQCDSSPATFSSFWLRRILRRRLGYGGLIISDDLSMAGAAIGTMKERMRTARAAGCDLLLICGREDMDNALSAATTKSTKNHWLQLAPTADAEVQLNSPKFYQALQKTAAPIIKATARIRMLCKKRTG